MSLISCAFLLLLSTTTDASAKDCAANLGSAPTGADIVKCLKEIQDESQIKPAIGLSVLNKETLKTSGSDDANSAKTAIAIGPYDSGAVVMISATGTSSYKADRGGSGILLVISLDGTPVSQDDSFEGSSEVIDYFAAASHVFYLAPGTSSVIEAAVQNYGWASGNNKKAKVALSVFALAAQGH